MHGKASGRVEVVEPAYMGDRGLQLDRRLGVRRIEEALFSRMLVLLEFDVKDRVYDRGRRPDVHELVICRSIDDRELVGPDEVNQPSIGRGRRCIEFVELARGKKLAILRRSR